MTNRWRQHWTKIVVAVLGVTLALTGCAGPEKHVDRPVSREAGPPFNWDAPQAIGSFLPVTDISKYISDLSFNVVQPQQLSGLLNIYVTDPTKVLKDAMLVEYYYQDPTYGRLVVTETLKTIQQSDLEARLSYNEDSNSEAVFALVTLNDGTEAVLETQRTPSADGLAPNSIEFFETDTEIVVFGQDGSFTPETATKVANLLIPPK